MTKGRLVLVGSLLASMSLLMGPAQAIAPPVLIVVAPATSVFHDVSGTCKAVVGAATGLQEITYAVHGEATSSSDHTVGTGTTVACRIKDKTTGAIYGTISMGLPGPHAEVVGTIPVPILSNPHICWKASAQFLDGHSVSRSFVCGL